MRPKRVPPKQRTRLILVHDSIGGTTGMGRVVAAMARIALEAGLEVTLVGIDVDRSFGRVHHVPIERRSRLPALVANLCWVAAVYRRLWKEDLSEAIVHVHAPLLMPIADLFTCHHLAEGAARHGLREPAGSIEGMLRRAQEMLIVGVDSMAYRRRPPTTRVTFVSEFLRREFIGLYGLPNGGEILPPPAPPWDPISANERAAARSRYDVHDGEIAVGYFGGNDPRKGISQVLQLAADPRYVVLGAGTRTRRIQFGARLGLGYVDVRDVLAACDVVVAPTIFDAAPVAVLEAVAAGLPVVTGPNSGWAEPLCRFGAGASCGAQDALAEVIDAVVPGSLAAAEAFTENFSYDAFAAKLAALWDPPA